MDRKKLSQYRDLIREIDALEKRYYVCEYVKGSSREFPYNMLSFKVEGNTIAKRKHKAYKLKEEIDQYIADIDDSRTRQVFELRYIDGYSWLKISRKLGSHDESYARKIHDRFLKNA